MKDAYELSFVKQQKEFEDQFKKQQELSIDH